MPTIFSHIAVPIAAAVALGSKRIPPSMLLAGMVAAILPDFDGVAFKLGIHYGGIWGHRGFTHTLGFALRRRPDRLVAGTALETAALARLCVDSALHVFASRCWIP
jgi:membrane-bound metal-dependent hydrolase YbcI (DUF457 family)